MKHKILTMYFLLNFLLVFVAVAPVSAENLPNKVDKAFCAKMIRFGDEAYQRSRYLDAKEYFRKAIKADPSSTQAWKKYDLAVLYSLAEKTNQNLKIFEPGVSDQNLQLNKHPADNLITPINNDKEQVKEEEQEYEFEGC